MDLQKDYYQKVEEPGYLKHVLYSDTDSIYIVIPTDISGLAVEQKNELAKKVSVDINNNIQKYLYDTYFKRANIENKHNMTDFKTEVLMDSIMFIPKVKKQYAFNMIAEGPKIFDPPKTEYKGIQVVRSDATELGKTLLRDAIEGVVLNGKIKKKDKIQHIIDIVNNAHDLFLKSIEDFKFDDITVSVKWGKSMSIINSMVLYNFITKTNIFLPASAGKFVYCKFGNLAKFRELDIDTKKLNSISVPYRYSVDELKATFKEYSITIDVEKQWSRVYTTTVQRIVDLVKEEAK